MSVEAKFCNCFSLFEFSVFFVVNCSFLLHNSAFRPRVILRHTALPENPSAEIPQDVRRDQRPIGEAVGLRLLRSLRRLHALDFFRR